jgi:hypothetical protein
VCYRSFERENPPSLPKRRKIGLLPHGAVAPLYFGNGMPRRPASITQADVARCARAAKQAGAAEVEVNFAVGTILIRMLSTATATAPSLEPPDPVDDSGEIVL